MSFVSKISMRMVFDTQRSVTAAQIAAGWPNFLAVGVTPGTALNADPSLAHPTRQFFIQNLTNAPLQFSFDNTNNHFVLPVNGYFSNDITANQKDGIGFFMAKGDRLYVRQVDAATVPNTGSVYFTTTYGRE